MLLSLFSVCLACSNSTVACVKGITGTFVQVQQLCQSCGHKRLWNSQPYIGNVPAGNLLLSTSILCAGALPSMVLRVLKYLKCSAICKDTFFRHQTAYLQPCISTVWMRHQRALLRSLKDEELVVAGDGRSDSPGYTAKFGSYTLMDLKRDKVITFELIQV